MRGTILYGAGDVRFEERPDPVIRQPTDAIIKTVATCVCGSDLWPYRGIDTLKAPRAYRARVRRRRRGGRLCGHRGRARPVRGRRILCLRRQLPALSGRLPVLLCEPELVRRLSVGVHPDPAGRRHSLRDPGSARRGPDSEPAGAVRRDEHGLARRDQRERVAGHDGGRCRRRRGRPVRGAGRSRARRGTDHRDEPARVAAEARDRVRRHRHRRRARRRGHRGDHGTDRWGRRGRRLRGGRHGRLDDTGGQVGPTRRNGRCGRRAARSGSAAAADVLPQRGGEGRSAHRYRTICPRCWTRCSPGPSSQARSSTSSCRSTRWRRATRRWTNAARSRRCYVLLDGVARKLAPRSC